MKQNIKRQANNESECVLELISIFLYYFVSSVILSKFVITGLCQNKIFRMLKSQRN